MIRSPKERKKHSIAITWPILTGSILILIAILITSKKYFGTAPTHHNQNVSSYNNHDSRGSSSTPIEDQNSQLDANNLIKQLSLLRKDGSAVPDDLRIASEKLINSTEISYKSRIQLAILALSDEWSAKHIQIIFRNEISKRPFETIQDLFKLVPDGRLQDEVSASISQTVLLTSSEAPMATTWLASLPDSSRKKAVSIIYTRLMHNGDLETLRSLEKASPTDALKKSFSWAVQELEKQQNSPPE